MKRIINISYERNQKKINNRSLDELLKDFQKDEKEYTFIKEIFNKANNENEIISELKAIKAQTTPVTLLLIIKIIGRLTVSEAQPIFDKVMED